jgi:hypothetical protein
MPDQSRLWRRTEQRVDASLGLEGACLERFPSFPSSLALPTKPLFPKFLPLSAVDMRRARSVGVVSRPRGMSRLRRSSLR